MKIIAIGRNYADHAKEMNSPVPKEPILFMKPHNALLRNNMPFDYPTFSKEVEYEVEIVVRICRNGKHIREQEADKYFDAVGIGIDFTARDLQRNCKEKGLPWEIAKAFDHSAAVSNLKPVPDLGDLAKLPFSLKKNGTVVQQGTTADMLFSFTHLIAYASRFFTLNIGDLIFTGTPAGVGQVQKDDKLEALIHDEVWMTCEVK